MKKWFIVLIFSLFLSILLISSSSATIWNEIQQTDTYSYVFSEYDSEPFVFDKNKGLSSDSSLKLDTKNRPHVSYYDASNGDLCYAYFDGVKWNKKHVDTSANVGQFSSITIDSKNRPHISYYDISNGNLKYAKYTGTQWIIKNIDIIGDVGKYTFICLDKYGNPQISYYDASNQDLKFAKFTGSNWIKTTIDKIGNVGQYSSITIDSKNRPHISYYDSTKGDLRYASFNGSKWIKTIVDSIGCTGAYTSIHLDKNNRPNISYYDVTNQYLRYASFNGSKWIKSTIDNLKYYNKFSSELYKYGILSNGGTTSLELDSKDNPHIVYITSDSLRYASFNGYKWTKKILKTTKLEGTDEDLWGSFIGKDSSFALNSSGTAYISFIRVFVRQYNHKFWFNHSKRSILSYVSFQT